MVNLKKYAIIHICYQKDLSLLVKRISFVLTIQKRHLCNFYLNLIANWSISNQENAYNLTTCTIPMSNQSNFRKIENAIGV